MAVQGRLYVHFINLYITLCLCKSYSLYFMLWSVVTVVYWKGYVAKHNYVN